MDYELMFNLCNIKALVEKMLKSAEKDITAGMNEDNKAGYDCGVKNALSLLEQAINIGEDEGSIIVNKTGLKSDCDYEECDLRDLLEKFDARVSINRN